MEELNVWQYSELGKVANGTASNYIIKLSLSAT